MKKIDIKDSSDMNCVLSDMFHDFLENLSEHPNGYTTPAEGNSLFEYENGIQWYYTDKGMALIERWEKRMKKIYDQYFDDGYFNPESTYYKEF